MLFECDFLADAVQLEVVLLVVTTHIPMNSFGEAIPILKGKHVHHEHDAHVHALLVVLIDTLLIGD